MNHFPQSASIASSMINSAKDQGQKLAKNIQKSPAWSKSFLFVVLMFTGFLILVAIIEYQFNNVHQNMNRMRMNMIRELDRERLIKILTPDASAPSNSSFRANYTRRAVQ